MERDDEFTYFAAARWGALVRAAVVLGCSAEDADDLAQTTLVRCYRAWQKVAEADDRDAYVYRILLNCHRDNRRRRWWSEHPTSTLPDAVASDWSEQVVAADAIHRALAELSLEQREVVVLRHLAQLSERRTAELLGVAPGTVKSRLSRAIALLATNPHLSEGRRR